MCLFFALNGDKNGVWIWLAGVATVLVIIGLIWLNNKLRKKPDPRDKLKEQEPEFKEPQLNSQNEMFISIPRNVTYTVGEGKGDMIRPGAYILRSSKNSESFNVRFGGLVQEFSHNTKITLGVGDSLCGVSDSLVVVADLPKEEE